MSEQKPEHVQRIVVGVDSSEGSTTALRWAMRQARLTGATVEAVAAWEQPTAYGYGYGYVTSPSTVDVGTMQTTTEKNLAETVADAAGRQDQPGAVRTSVVQGHPVQVLIAAAAGAEMLVVGSRGHGTFAGLLLGSVSQHCVQHAPCPVVVVPQ